MHITSFEILAIAVAIIIAIPIIRLYRKRKAERAAEHALEISRVTNQLLAAATSAELKKKERKTKTAGQVARATKKKTK